MAINANSLENLIKTQGILLEHQTHDALLNYFGDSSANRYVVNHEVSHRGYLEESEIEVDVLLTGTSYFEVFEYSYVTTVEGQNLHRHVQHPRHVTTLVVAECKGHPSQGLLLCRLTDRAFDNKQERVSVQYLYDPNLVHPAQKTWIAGTARQENDSLVDWAYFYKPHEGKSNQGKVVYQEDKEKSFRAFGQLEKQVRYAWQKLEHITGEAIKGERNVFRILPLVVTNAPIVAMNIKSGSVEFSEYPWVTFVHHPQQNLAQKDIRFNSRFFFVVNAAFLTGFLDAYLPAKASLSRPASFVSSLSHSMPI